VSKSLFEVHLTKERKFRVYADSFDEAIKKAEEQLDSYKWEFSSCSIADVWEVGLGE